MERVLTISPCLMERVTKHKILMIEHDLTRSPFLMERVLTRSPFLMERVKNNIFWAVEVSVTRVGHSGPKENVLPKYPNTLLPNRMFYPNSLLLAM